MLHLLSSNFRSIKEEQTLNLFAEGLKEDFPENISYPGNEKIGVLKTAGIYGANASGKSTLLLACGHLQSLILNSGNYKLEESIDEYDPFFLDSSMQKTPTSFEIEFFLKKTRYIYKVSYTNDIIIYEELIAYLSSQPTSLFLREERDDGIFFKPSTTKLKGKRIKIPFKKNNLYLSIAANNGEGAKVLEEVYLFFKNDINIRSAGELEQFKSSNKKILSNNLIYKNIISIFLEVADTGIKEINVTERDIPEELFKGFDSIGDNEFADSFKEEYKYETTFKHQIFSDNKPVDTCFFNEFQESTGTLKMYNLAILVLNALIKGEALFIDEIGSSMHSFMTEFIIKLFNDPSLNTNNAQLIFTTHDTCLMNENYMRRDQLWFTEKDIYGATRLFSLDEFNKDAVRKNSSFAKYYHDGRFGGIPNLDYNKLADKFRQVIFKQAREEQVDA